MKEGIIIHIDSDILYLDDPEIYDGAPVGVQIVARKYEEEKIWAIGKIVYDCLQQSEDE
jgi:Asp-tRNA(Asn)/Glu-tRNA(Gln) amidotransferase A subunit family amidase